MSAPVNKIDELRNALMQAAIDCTHSICHNEIILYHDKDKEGNALHQLAERLLAAALAAPQQHAQAAHPLTSGAMQAMADAGFDVTVGGEKVQPRNAQAAQPFQQRVQPWMMECFGEMISGDREERNHRFLEESLELVQSTGCTAHEAHQLVDYVYGRPVGDPPQEVGGVMVTLAALCLANGLDMHECAEIELARIWTKVEAIRAKQAAKPKHSPLPVAAPAQPIAGELPPLPETNYNACGDGSEPLYTPEMVQDYATAYGHQCRAAALEEAAKEVERLHPYWDSIAAAIRALNKTEK